MSKGAAWERACRRRLRDAGWFAVRVSDSSQADVVAVRREGNQVRVLLVECKSGASTCGPAQWNDLVQAAARYGATPVLATKLPGVTEPQFFEMVGLKSGVRGQREPKAPFDIDDWQSGGIRSV